MEEKENSDGRQGEEAQGQMESEFKKERERDYVWGLEERGSGKDAGKLRVSAPSPCACIFLSNLLFCIIIHKGKFGTLKCGRSIAPAISFS